MTESQLARDVMRKVSWRVLPLLCAGYMCAYMDRVNISFAALQMNTDLGFSATVYGLGAGLFFLGYAIFEVPSSILLVKLGPRRCIAGIMIAWGSIATGMLFVRTPLQFYVLRFLLGVAEATFLPSVIFYLKLWFPNSYRGRAISRFFVAPSIAGVLIGVISGGLLSLDGDLGLRGWQWLFLLQGPPSLLVAFLSLKLLPDSPTVPWLRDAERSWIMSESMREADALGEAPERSFLAALTHPVVLYLGVFGFLIMGASAALELSMPLVLQAETHFDPVSIGWIVSVANALAVCGILICGSWTDRRGERWSILLASSPIVPVILLAMALSVGHAALTIVAAYMAFKFVFSFTSSSSLMLAPDLLHARTVAVGVAVLDTIAQVGAFVAPVAWGMAKDATGGYRTGLFGLAAVTLLATVIVYALARRRRPAREAAVAQ